MYTKIMKKIIRLVPGRLLTSLFITSGLLFIQTPIAFASDVPVDIDTIVNETLEGEQNNPRAIALGNGNIFVVWTSRLKGNDSDVYTYKTRLMGKIINQRGEAVKGEFAVSDEYVNYSGKHNWASKINQNLSTDKVQVKKKMMEQ
jgi:hypothetical protein